MTNTHLNRSSYISSITKQITPRNRKINVYSPEDDGGKS